MTKQEIKKEVAKIFGVQVAKDVNSWYNDYGMTLTKEKDDISIKLVEMYRYPDTDMALFETLQALATLFGTQKINIGDRLFENGCETCDHGSRYEVTYWVLEPTINNDWD